MRKRHAIGMVASLVLLAQEGGAVAQSSDTSSANEMMQGCREPANATARHLPLQSECIGTVRTMLYFSRSHFGACSPDWANVGQALRVIVRYVDQRPERMHERFEFLALEALQQAWPCKR
jgi:hypothetical protein